MRYSWLGRLSLPSQASALEFEVDLANFNVQHFNISLEYTFTSLSSLTESPVYSLTSRGKASSMDSPFLIFSPGNHHCPLAGLFFLLKNSSLLSLTMIASTDGIGIHFTILSYRESGIKPSSAFKSFTKLLFDHLNLTSCNYFPDLSSNIFYVFS